MDDHRTSQDLVNEAEVLLAKLFDSGRRVPIEWEDINSEDITTYLRAVALLNTAAAFNSPEMMN